MNSAKSLFSYLVPTVSIEDEGIPTVRFGIAQASRSEPELEDVLAAPATLAARGKRQVVIVFDEVQRISDYESDRVERRLRSIIQHHSHVSYIFLGSRKHLIQKMFLDRSRLLYRAAGHYPLRSIKEQDGVLFIHERFRIGRQEITDDQIRTVCRLTEGHSFYTQHLCHVSWELCEENHPVPGESIDSALEMLLE